MRDDSAAIALIDGVFFDTDADRDAERDKHADLFGEPGHEDQNDVLRYAAGTTDLNRSTIAQMYAEEVAYEDTQGIMGAGAYDYFKAWADDVKDAEPAEAVN